MISGSRQNSHGYDEIESVEKNIEFNIGDVMSQDRLITT